MSYKYTRVQRSHTKIKAPPQPWCIPTEWGNKPQIAPILVTTDANSPELLKALAKRARKANKAKESNNGTR